MRLGCAPPHELYMEEIWLVTATFRDIGKATTALSTFTGNSYEMGTTTLAIDIEYSCGWQLPIPSKMEVSIHIFFI